MSFFRKILGIEELEKKVDKEFKQVETNLKTSWNWINYLHELEQDNKLKIKNLIEENNQLKDLIKERNEVVVPEPIQSSAVQTQEETDLKTEKIAVEEKVQEKTKGDSLSFKNVDISGLGKKEGYILQILYQMACFDASSAIETSRVHDNLPYTITMRGLRKKMYKLQDQGVVNSVMVGNSRRWFLDMNKLSRLKQFLAQQA